jgi:hypothetical protein
MLSGILRQFRMNRDKNDPNLRSRMPIQAGDAWWGLPQLFALLGFFLFFDP